MNRILTVTLSVIAICVMTAAFAEQAPFESVDQVLDDLRSDPQIKFREQDGWLIAEGHYTIWTFTTASHPAHPAVVERRVYEEDGSIHIGTRAICTAEEEVCNKLYRDLGAGDTATESSNETSASRILEQPGVSISLAEDNRWTVTRRTAVLIVLRQDGASAGDSVVGAVQLERLPVLNSDEEFLDFVVAQRKESLGNDPRVVSPEFDERVVGWKGHACVEFRYRYTDSGAVQQDGSTSEMKFANNGLRCRHPDDETIGVRVSYSARYKDQLDTDLFEAKAQEFIDSVSLRPFGTEQ